MNAPDRTPPSIQLTVNGLALGFRVDKRLLPAVTDIAFTLNGGETLALVGESGCGKSASALALMRLLPVSGCITSGEVRFDGRDLLQLPEAEMRRVRGRDLAMIFQEPATSLNPVMTVCEQIGEALTRCGRGDLSKAGVRRRAGELLSAVGIGDIERRLDAYPFQLSGGLKQRVMIAMALAGEPKILIADEPTTALDVTVQAQILELLRRLQRETGMGMLLITHDLAVVAETADRVGVMYAGELVEIADHAAFFSHHFHPYTQKLFAALPGHSLASAGSGHGHGHIRGESLQTIPGQAPAPGTFPSGCRFAPRCAFAWERCHRESPGWQTLPTPTGAEHRVRCHLAEKQGGMDGKADGKKEGKQSTGIIVDRKEYPQNAAQTGQPAAAGRHSQQAVLKVTGLTVHFPIRKGLLQRQSGAVRAVDGVSLELGSGKTLALVGESGCGKTTVGKAILRLVDSSGGTIYLGPGEGQRDIRSMTAREFSAVRHRVQMVFQDPFSSLNPRMRIGDIIEEGMVALGISAGKAGREARLAALAALLAQVGLPADAGERFPHEFSGGQRQRIAIARVLAVQPQIILLDEPTSALDVSVQARILNLLKDLQKELGLAYLFITHNFAVVDEMADDVAVMYLGRIVESGSARTLLAAPHHPYTQSLLSAIPRIGHRVEEGVARLAGEAPSPANPSAGCHFHPRCPQAMDICRRQYPAVVPQDEGRQVACHLFKLRD